MIAADLSVDAQLDQERTGYIDPLAVFLEQRLGTLDRFRQGGRLAEQLTDVENKLHWYISNPEASIA